MGRAPFSLHRRGEPLVTRIALVGLPGAGKSTVAPLLARRLGFESVDLDREIERLAGASVPAILDAQGEERFRDLESLALAEALDGARPRVVACGGGILGRARNRQLLKERARVVWLKVDPGTAAARLRALGTPERPLLRGAPLEERLGDLLASRGSGYAQAADGSVEAGAGGPEEIADRIVALIAALQARWGSSES